MTVHTSEDLGEKLYTFRPIRTRKIEFSVRASKNACICLAAHPDNGSDDMYEIILGAEENSHCIIIRNKEEEVHRVEDDVLDEEEFKTFSIKLSRGKIKIYKKRHLFSLIKHDVGEWLKHVKYYGYTTTETNGEWTFADEREDSATSSSAASSSDSEAEQLDAFEIRPIMYKRPARWVFCADGYTPNRPVCGGEGNDGPVYVGMAHHEGGHILGMVVPSENVCYIPFGGEAVPKDDYYMLVNPSGMEYEWKGANAGKVPAGALQGGYTEDGESLFIGRVSVDGVVSCGKVHPSHGCCYVPYGGIEHAHTQYEVLCVSSIPCRIRL